MVRENSNCARSRGRGSTNRCSMNPRSHRLCASLAYSMSLFCVGMFLTSVPSTARAAGVVGTGTAESCTDAALDAVLFGAGW